MKAKISEAELALKFIAWFSDVYEIYKEVPAYGIIDFVATDGIINIGVEVKTSLNIDVIEQAYKNLSFCQYCYVAVPAAKGRGFAYQVCRDYGIGVLEYEKSSYGDKIIERGKPRLNRIRRDFYKLQLQPYQKENVAGLVHGRVTAFGNTVNEITALLKRNNGKVKIKEVFTQRFHYNSFTAAESSIYGMCRKGVITSFYFDSGYVILT